jgi:pyruvate ferredoxin oxidoreductase alpha subunit
MGSISETAMTAVDTMRADGRKVGLVRLRLWRPFPFEELVGAVSSAKQIAVVDRALALNGSGGPLAGEVKAALYDEPERPYIWNYVAGLAGRDVTVENFVEMADGVEAAAADRLKPGYTMINVRE